MAAHLLQVIGLQQAVRRDGQAFALVAALLTVGVRIRRTIMNTRKTMASHTALVAAGNVVQRRDGAGHPDARFTRGMLKRVKHDKKTKESDGVEKMIPGSQHDALAQLLGREFVQTATSGEDESLDDRDTIIPGEDGGPFVNVSGSSQYAAGVDGSNPVDTTREPFPRS